jgi:hypothetical protein
VRWFANKNICRQRVEMMLVDESHGRRAFGKPPEIVLEVERDEDVGRAREPTLSLPYGAAEALLQALWDQGFRPNNGEGGPAEAVALRKHIAFAERVAIALLPTDHSSEVLP